MSVFAALRSLLDNQIDVMIVEGNPGVRVIALKADGTDNGRGAERKLPFDVGDTALRDALKELAIALC